MKNLLIQIYNRELWREMVLSELENALNRFEVQRQLREIIPEHLERFGYTVEDLLETTEHDTLDEFIFHEVAPADELTGAAMEWSQ